MSEEFNRNILHAKRSILPLSPFLRSALFFPLSLPSPLFLLSFPLLAPYPLFSNLGEVVLNFE